ncbi:uncharacterized protein N7482_004710 [Penicillium canariense]|uniref:Wings apart-like protein C-terminal domain-containing protein n=1 Tax=Penicillium canariense TaxID=189055 RepID=A0A9W9I739_9EURO|nr:uncharacterized protein N7482_004710 [Penicillium canariense]KAJ5169116.1 hypothetical protein N7482_004710 [Penicillium canariense]
MVHSGSRSRRLVTYGSSSKAQSHFNTVSARASTAKSSKDLPSTPGSSHPSTGEVSGTEPGHKQEISTETAQVPEPRGASRLVTEASIYDLPSSDEGDQHLIVQRKRRRYGANGNAALTQQSPAVRPMTGFGIGVGPQDPSTKLDSASSRTETFSPREIKDASGRGRPGPRTGGRKLDSGSQKTKESLPKNDSQARQTAQPLSLDTNGQPSQSRPERTSYTNIMSSPMEPGPTSPRKHTRTRGGNTTPTRRRLIDSLGTKEQSADASSNITTTSQPPSPFTPHSPNRLKEPPPPNMCAQTEPKDLGQDTTVAISPHLTGSKVTYARQRSFLDDLPMASGLPEQNPVDSLGRDSQLMSQPRSFDDIPRARLFDIEEVNNDDGSVRSIHELRQAGGNARYRGAVESIFEDIEDPHMSTSGRCNSFVQLCGKLLDSKLSRQFVECSFDRRLVDCLSSDLDMVSATLALCVFGLSSLGRSLPYVLATAAWPKLLDLSPSLLGAQTDISAITRARNNNLSKAAQRSVQNISPRINIALFPDASAPTLSPCLIALHCLRVTSSAFQAKSEIPGGLPAPMLNQLVNILLSESSHIRGKVTVAPERSYVLITGLSILEIHTTSGDPVQRDHHDALSILAGMHSLLQMANMASEVDAVRQQLQILYLRVILNVTNSNPILCDKFATPAMVEELAAITMARFGDLTEDSLSQENNSLDTVILALGALINLVEQSEASRTMFLNPACVAQSLLDQLLRLFLAHVDSTSKAHSVLEVHHNVAVGYLAILLLALCLHPGARVQVKESLHPNGLAVIMSTVNEFLQYHQKIEQESYSVQANRRETSGFLVRLQDLISQIQHIDDQ